VCLAWLAVIALVIAFAAAVLFVIVIPIVAVVVVFLTPIMTAIVSFIVDIVAAIVDVVVAFLSPIVLFIVDIVATVVDVVVAFLSPIVAWVVAYLVWLCTAVIVLSSPLVPLAVYYGYMKYSVHQARYYCLKRWKDEGRAVDAAEDAKVLSKESRYADKRASAFFWWVAINAAAGLVLLARAALSSVEVDLWAVFPVLMIIPLGVVGWYLLRFISAGEE
jgi:hypothetical protein